MRQSLPAGDELGSALADLAIAPRLLTRERAAADCGLSVRGFGQLAAEAVSLASACNAEAKSLHRSRFATAARGGAPVIRTSR